jgi:hypothetical protein
MLKNIIWRGPRRLGSMSCEEIKTKIRAIIDNQTSLGWTWVGMTCQGTILHLQFKNNPVS